MVAEIVVTRYFRALWKRIRDAKVKRYLRREGILFHSDLVVYGCPIVSLHPNSRIEIGRRVVLCSTAQDTALGVNHAVVLRTMRSSAEVIIGEDVGISGASICAAKSVTIGANTLIGANAMIADTDFHTLAPEGRRYERREERIRSSPVVIGANVFIGANVIILKGVTIGENAVIGAGSVVVRDIPPNAIAAGNPCEQIRTIA